MKFIFLKKHIILFIFLIGFTETFAQKTEMPVSFDVDFHNALELYNNKLYAGAYKLFKKVSKKAHLQSTLKSDADYYAAMCSIKMKNTDATDEVMSFVDEHYSNSRKEKAYLNVGNYYFANRKASHALKWYSKVNPDKLTESERNEMNYKMAYALLVSKYFADAKDKFATLLGHPRYGNDARYYYGYIAYRQENFEEANENFAQLANDAAYQSEANYYLLDIAFKNGDFKKAIEIGEKILPKHEKGQKSDIVKIIGESYFNIGKYDEAIPYLLEYKGEKGKWNNTDLYYVGYAYYKKEDYENAVKYFTKILEGNNTIAQNAYYHLGICYLKLDKKSEALNAFKNAYDMTFNAEITEDAAFNYTKLSYEEGNPYKSVPDVLKEFLAKYPNSKGNEEVKKLLITSYLYEHDFQGAIDYLTLHPGNENTKLITEISLYRGMQLFHEKDYKKARKNFVRASKDSDPKISNKAKFWLAETDFLTENFKKALFNFLSVNKNTEIIETKDLDYHTGYAHFKLKDYEKSKEYFNTFLASEHDPTLKIDALARLADSYYATKDYNKAISIYEKVIAEGGTDADYAQYQKAMSIGLLGNSDEKIKNLLIIETDYPESTLKDDALFQLATTYTAQDKKDTANETFKKLLKNHPQSSYKASVILRQGLLAYNKNDYDNALKNFKQVVDEFPNSTEAEQAITNARNVYIDTAQIDEYIEWVKTIPNINISIQEIEESSFIAAENRFLDNDLITSIKSFTSYIDKFPEGTHLLKANFYLAESFFRLDQKRKTIPHYTYVVNQEKNEFSEISLAKLTQAHLDLNQWKTAMPLLAKLEREANNQHNVIFAESNLMKGYYDQEKYDEALKYAYKVLENTKLDQVVEEEAKFVIARVSIINEDFETAREYYTIVDETADGEMKAETLYYKAYFLHQDKLYKDSNKEIQNLIENYSSYKYWGVKSYIIMAKNYFELKDSYQAAYILESVVKNFTEFKDLTEEANNELRKVKNEEAKQNESINSEIKPD